MPCPRRKGKEQQAGPTRLCGLQNKASVWLQAQELAELLHIFGTVLGLDHHHVSCTEPGDAGGAANHSHEEEPQQGHPDQHPHQGRQIPKFPTALTGSDRQNPCTTHWDLQQAP